MGARGEHQLSAVGGHEQAALHAHGVGHDDDGAVAPGGGDHGQANARVAGGGFDDDRAGLEQPLCLRVVEHGLGHPVLGGAGGVEILQLGQKGGVQALCPLDLAELQQGGSPDELLHRGVDSSHSRPPDCKGLHLHGIQ